MIEEIKKEIRALTFFKKSIVQEKINLNMIKELEIKHNIGREDIK